jgi:hypothetical protein
MSEGPPKQSQKSESREGAEKPPRYRTIEREILEVFEDGSKKERVLECNGKLHRRCVDVVSYDQNGDITYADQLSREELGECDGTH